jgi:hypothetical protein
MAQQTIFNQHKNKNKETVILTSAASATPVPLAAIGLHCIKA